MTRIQVLPLPMGEQDEAAPFALIVDEVCGDASQGIVELSRFAKDIGARGILLSTFSWDVS